MGKQKGNSSKILGLSTGKHLQRFPDWVGFDDAWPNEKLTALLVEIFSLLDPRRHRSQGGRDRPDIASRP